MEKNQNNHRNQQPDSKSKQPSKDAGKKETNPSVPVANQGKQQGSQPSKQQPQGSAFPKGKAGSNVTESEDNEIETNEETVSEERSNDSLSRQNESRSGNQSKKK